MKFLSLYMLLFCVVFSVNSEANGHGHGESHSVGEAKNNQFWWPEQLNLSALRQHQAASNPYGPEFDYGKAFEALDLKAVKQDIEETLTTSQDWWPADWGHYGPFMIRMAWHSAGVYRVHDGRGGAAGGQMRFDPLNSWPDNANLDKARRLLWPVKRKYGRSLSWADLMVLAGNVALESMGFQTFGFAGGRQDDWEPDLVYWGPETEFLAANRRDASGKLQKPLAAVQMGLIYVNPEGPGGVPDPIAAAKDIRESFGRMAMNDTEIVALIAGGHSFGKAHGATTKTNCVGKEPAVGSIEEQGFGWTNKCGSGKGADTITSGLEGAWTVTPTRWSNNYLVNLMSFEWVQTRSPAGAIQWIPKSQQASQLVPDAHVEGKRHAPIMFTTDLAMKEDPQFRQVVERFLTEKGAYEDAFARAWFKLTHRDMGPRNRYLGSEIPKEVLMWQDPIPAVSHPLISANQIQQLKQRIQALDIDSAALIRVAWAAASSHRVTDMRGGVNGARIALAPQNQWAINNPSEIKAVLGALSKLQQQFNQKHSGSPVSMADLIVLAAASAIEQAAQKGGYNVGVPFTPGRTDATQVQTDILSFSYLEPKADAFRNYYHVDSYMGPADMMIDKANLLGLTVPEMTVLVGGLRVLNANYGGAQHGVFTDKPGMLSTDFFVNLLDMKTRWQATNDPAIYQGYDRATNKKTWTATPVDLIFGANSELRAVAEVYACDDGKQKFVNDFVNAWVKVMRLDRFDL